MINTLPLQFIRGVAASTLVSQPPTQTELSELLRVRGSADWNKDSNQFIRAIGHSITAYKGNDSPGDFMAWATSCARYFDHQFLENVAIQATMAALALQGEAAEWWMAHRRLNPRRCLSFAQLGELLRIELIPTAHAGVAEQQWSRLEYEGDLEAYFRKIRTLMSYSPLPGMSSHVMAARPFGRAFEDRIVALATNAGPQGLTHVQFEANLRAYVQEMEARPGFCGWARNNLEPRYRKNAFRPDQETMETNSLRDRYDRYPKTVPEGNRGLLVDHRGNRFVASSPRTRGLDTRPTEREGNRWKAPTLPVTAHHLQPVDSDPEEWEEPPEGMIEEEWVARLMVLQLGTKGMPPDDSQRKYGQGPRPCFVCGRDGHSWIQCEKKKKGKCAACGSQAHYTRHCANRFFPRAEAVLHMITQHATGEVNNHEPASDLLPVRGPADSEGPAQLHQITRREGFEGEGKQEGIVSLMHVSQETSKPPRWFRDEVLLPSECGKLEAGIKPVHDPDRTGLLFYRVEMDGGNATVLLDSGATDCFITQSCVDRLSLRTFPLPRTIYIKHIEGQAAQGITLGCCVSTLRIGRFTCGWDLLVVSTLPTDAIIGLNFMRQHRFLLDGATDTLYPPPLPTSPRPRGLGKNLTSPRTRGLDKTELTESPLPNISLHSVTANSPEETEQLRQFRAHLPDALNQVIDAAGNLFQPPDCEPPERGIQHHIKLINDAVPIKRRPYPLSGQKLTAMREQMLELITQGWVEPSVSPWGAPILFVPKKGGALRMCIDYRDLNALTEDDSYPLPRLDVLLHSAAQAKVFSKIDLASGFHQIAVHPESRPLTAFRLPEAVQGSSLWQWKVMPFGLRNAPPTFQRAMAQALVGCEHCAVVYIDDVLIFSNDDKQHIQDLRLVFHQLNIQAYHVRLTKCEFMRREVEFLGHKLSPEGIATHPDKVAAVEKWVFPLKNAQQVKSFLGLISWYRTFIPHMATIAAPLFELTSGRRKFEWSPAHQKAADSLQRAVITAPVLARWERGRNTRIVTDGSKIGIGAVLEQLHPQGDRQPAVPRPGKMADQSAAPRTGSITDVTTATPSATPGDNQNSPPKAKKGGMTDPLAEPGSDFQPADPRTGKVAPCPVDQEKGWRPVAFWSRKLKDAETRYSATDLEWMAVVEAVTKVWPWMLEDQPFTICSDHKALERKLTKSAHDPPINDRQARWIESLNKFPYYFRWLKGETNTVADALSRYPVSVHSVTIIQSLLAGIWRRIQSAVPRDGNYQELIRQARDLDTSLSLWKGLVIDAEGRILVPADDSLRTLLISENHDPPMSGHLGATKTKELIERHWTWKGISRDVRNYVRSCVECQKSKHDTQKAPGRLYPIVARDVWKIVTMDFVEVRTTARNSAPFLILVIVDKFSKYVILEPCAKDVTAEQTADIFIRRVVSEHGIPDVVISDRGPQFTATLWRVLLRTLGSSAALAATHHPQTDGQTERVIQTLRTILRNYAEVLKEDATRMLPLFQFALNNAPTSTTRYSPFQILYGRNPRGPPDTFFPEQERPPVRGPADPSAPRTHEDQLARGPADLPSDCLPTDEQPVRGPADSETRRLTQTHSDQLLTQWVRRWWRARRKLREVVHDELEERAHQTKRAYDRRRPQPTLCEGDWVLLSTHAYNPYEQYHKGHPRYSGPYVIVRQVHPNAYEIEGLPPLIPRVQNIRFLRLFQPSPQQFNTRPQQTFSKPLQRGRHWEWEVEEVLDHCFGTTGHRYLVKWHGTTENTWMRPRQLRHCRDLLQAYQRQEQLEESQWTSSSSSECPTSSDSEDDSGETLPVRGPADSTNNPTSPPQH